MRPARQLWRRRPQPRAAPGASDHRRALNDFGRSIPEERSPDLDRGVEEFLILKVPAQLPARQHGSSAAIAAGEQPNTLTIGALLRDRDIPLSSAEQRRLFGFRDPGDASR